MASPVSPAPTGRPPSGAPADPLPDPDPGSGNTATAAADLGFGVRVAGNSRKRLLNPDGSFNVERVGLGAAHALAPYHALLSMGWGTFLLLTTAFYLVVNIVFALAFLACGPAALDGPAVHSGVAPLDGFLRAFFFSVETFGTIGYGTVAPATVRAHTVMTVESLVGLLSTAIATGLIFARFARPSALILYSKHAVIAPYRDFSAFMFRCANRRSNQLIEVSVRLIYSRIELRNGSRIREFTTLPLEYDRISFLALSWTVVHPITTQSPLFGKSVHDLAANEAEFLILLSATDESFSQTVHSRTSYRADEIVQGARFVPMFIETPDAGITGMDLSRIDELQPAPLP